MNKCGNCYFWYHKPDNRYNTFYDHIKQCAHGMIVREETLACFAFEPGKYRRKDAPLAVIDIILSKKEEEKIKTKAINSDFLEAFKRYERFGAVIPINPSCLLYERDGGLWCVYGNPKKISDYVETGRDLHLMRFKKELLNLDMESKINLASTLRRHFGKKDGAETFVMIFKEIEKIREDGL